MCHQKDSFMLKKGHNMVYFLPSPKGDICRKCLLESLWKTGWILSLLLSRLPLDSLPLLDLLFFKPYLFGPLFCSNSTRLSPIPAKRVSISMSSSRAAIACSGVKVDSVRKLQALLQKKIYISRRSQIKIQALLFKDVCRVYSCAINSPWPQFFHRRRSYPPSTDRHTHSLQSICKNVVLLVIGNW